MKELAGTAQNYHYLENDKHQLLPMAELVIVLSEPQYHLTADELVRERDSSSIRIGMNLKAVLTILATLLEIKQELEKMEERQRGK